MERRKLTFKPRIIGIAGTIASGKDAAADYLVKAYGFKKITLSNYLRAEALKRGQSPTRSYLRKLQAWLREKHGDDYLINKVIETIMKKDHIRMLNVVIVGLRLPMETKKAKEQLKAKLIFVDADPFIRYLRQKRRQRKSGFAKTYEQFLHEEALENAKFDFHKVRKMANFRIDNNGSLREMYKQIDKIAKRLKLKKKR